MNENLRIDSNNNTTSAAITNDATEGVRNLRIDDPTKGLLTFDAASYIEIAKGNVPGHSVITKFGRNGAVSATLSHISISGQYQTPTTAQSLEILSSQAADGPAGAGGRKVIVEGLDSNWNFQTEEVELDGVTPVALQNDYIRVFRGFVSESGSYVTTAIPSHVGQITLRGAGAGVTWFIIDNVQETTAAGFGIGQTQIGSYTIPAGKTAYLISKTFSVEATKTARIYFFKREQGDDITTPYRGIMRLFEQNDGIATLATIQTPAPMQAIPEKSEVGFFATAAVGTPSVSAEFQLLLIDN